MGSLRIALCWCGLAALAPLGAVSSALSDGFAVPPRESRPVVWWWWTDDMSHMPRAAITRDLEGLKRVGICGFHIYGGSVAGKDWTEKAKWAFHEANRLGLDGYVMIGAAGCGHRATPHRFAPKDIVFTTVRAEGGRDIRIALPKKGVKETPKNPDGSPELYTDIITLAAPGVPGGADFPLDAVVDVSGYLDSGTDEFVWPNAPTGTWTIVRCAWVPKVFGWMGCYIDHLSREAMDDHWSRVVKPLLGALAPDERKALKGVLCDSWEAGTTSWTEKFPEEFRRLHGYSVYPWLVHKAGLGPGDRASRAKFRRDWDETISALIAENHYAHKRELAHGEGLVSIAEACGPHQTQGDVRRMQGRCDVAMGEFWMPCNHRPEDTQRFMVRDAATAAHVYGMREVLAEAFTTIGTYWIESPRTLKPCADRAFCDGLTRVCYHGMKLSGSLADRPGAIRNVGTHYNPQTTWFEQSKAFNLYLSRCSWMLSQGRFVADALVYAGDAINVFAGTKDVRDALGTGFDYDFCPTELLVQAKVEDGEIVLPSGMRYKALVISDKNPASKRMAPGKLPPEKSLPSVSHVIPPEARAAIARIEKGGVSVLRTRNERQAWAAKRTPDFVVAGVKDASSIDWIHRAGDFGDLYFLANRTEVRQVFTAKLRTAADAVELWDPVTGERKRAIADRTEGGGAEVKVDLSALGSVFVVFPKEATAKSSRTLNPTMTKVLSGPWTVTFDPKAGGPSRPVVFDELTDWTERPETEIRHYSGTAEYRTTVAFDPSTMRKGSRVMLDLGNVREIAEVRVNGRDCGTVWTPPCCVDITEAVSANLKVAIRVTNLWPNRLIGDAALPAEERIARTNLNKYKAEDPLLPSGLVGPVTVRMESEGARTVVVNGREWELGSEVSVSGTCVTVKTDGVRTRSASVRTSVDLSPYLTDGLEWRVRAKGRGVVKPAQNWLGVKAMLSYVDAGGKRQYPGPLTKSGDFGWYLIRYRTAFKNGVKGLGTFTLGLQETAGEACFDLSTFQLGPAKVKFPADDPTWRCEYSEELKARPRLRGVMSPSRPMTEDDFRKLHAWGVTLLRYQMNRFWSGVDKNRDLADYDSWLNGRLDHLEAVVLPLAEKYGIRVLIDLHMPSGGKAMDGEMNLFHEREYARHFVACWLRIARRFKGRPAVCGYDLLNEPVQNYNAVGVMDYWTLQAETAVRIRDIDPVTPIYLEGNRADSPTAFAELPVLKLRDVVYQVHLYAPMEFTHQGVHGGRPFVPTKWPDETKGWNRDFLRKKLEPVRAFEERHGAKIYVGEFSAIAWAEGAENYLADCIALFEEYGWDWSYHAYGEFAGWSVEHAADKPYRFRPAESTPRKDVLLKGFAK